VASKQITAIKEAGIEPVSPGGFQSLADIVQTIIEISDVLETATDEERPVIESELERVVAAELATKVDGIAMFNHRCVGEIEILEAWIKEAEQRVGVWNRRQKRVRDLCKWGMIKLGAKSLRGKITFMSLRAGAESLSVYDPTLIPLKYRIVTITATAEQWINRDLSGAMSEFLLAKCTRGICSTSVIFGRRDQRQ
jgi:hypothetical protein